MSVDNLTPEAFEGSVESSSSRSQFINRTYMHLFGAIAVFAALEYALLQTPFASRFTLFIFETQSAWLGVLGAFIVISWIATSVAHKVESKSKQYAALGIFILAEAIVFVPMLFIAQAVAPEIIEKAVWVTLGAFAGLTAVAMLSGRDFSFLKSFLMWGGVVALGTIVMGIVAGFELGTYFSMAMIGLAGASILYDTSKIIRDYPEDRYIAAALQLFASVALMFWYVLRFFLSRD
jgi:FtsH-binding integral membrane protein